MDCQIIDMHTFRQKKVINSKRQYNFQQQMLYMKQVIMDLA